MEGFRGLKCSVKCVECKDRVGCVCYGHCWVLYVLLLGGAELDWALPPQCSVPCVNAFVALSCFVMVVRGSYYCCYCY